MRPAVFLDRDGTITKYKDFITDLGQLELEAGAAKGIKILNNFGFKVIVVTNQPQVARGMCTEADVEKINRSMTELLEKEGAHIDAIYFCPHHPERNHPDIPPQALKYRIDCECRKPNAGMLQDGAKKFNIALERSFMVGDTTVDLEAGRKAGCATILVKTGKAGSDGKHSAKADYVADNLENAAKIITMRGVKGVILAGGRGERLRPFTDTMPKPMLQIGEKPVLEHQINSLRKSGIAEIIILGSYLIEKIKEYFGAGERFGVRIEYPQELEQLGTGGAIK
ncbi:MAG: HAD-IIIA family hydrolase, partial [bacterium]|nr:HAD-IIIA family hydrolase [bacterium]